MFYQRAADLGDAEAMQLLGDLYYDKDGVRIADGRAKAVRYFRMGAKRGNTNAINSLGDALYRGAGVARDYAEAVRLFKLAIERGVEVSCFDVGCCYENGLGVVFNLSEAITWYVRAAKKKKNDGHCPLGREGRKADAALARIRRMLDAVTNEEAFNLASMMMAIDAMGPSTTARPWPQVKSPAPQAGPGVTAG